MNTAAASGGGPQPPASRPRHALVMWLTSELPGREALIAAWVGLCMCVCARACMSALVASTNQPASANTYLQPAGCAPSPSLCRWGDPWQGALMVHGGPPGVRCLA